MSNKITEQPKIVQIVNNMCYWVSDMTTLEEAVEKYPPDCLFVKAPGYVTEQWGYDASKEGDERFIKPVPPEGFVYDDETGAMYPESMIPVMLANEADAKQNQNKAALSKWLDENPLEWIDGKLYGITMEDQTEIQLNLSQYQIAVQSMQAAAESGTGTLEDVHPRLEWHSIHEACVPWEPEQLMTLANAISEKVYPAYSLMQDYKVKIYAAKTRQEIRDIKLDYSSLNPKEEGEEEETVRPADPEDVPQAEE